MGAILSMFSNRAVVPQNSFIDSFVKKNILSQEVITLLDNIKNSSRIAYDALLKQLHLISDPNADSMQIVYIKEYHFDIVVRVLLLQKSLSPNTLLHIKGYLDAHKPDSISIIQNLRRKYLSGLNIQSHRLNLAHHTIDHGVELKTRAMQVITCDLHIYNTDSAFDRFMRNILGFAFECHDYIQGEAGYGYKSVEEQTADLLLSWLISEDGFPNLSIEVQTWIKYQIHYMIPIATTVVFSKTNPVHLTKLLDYFEVACQRANIAIYHHSNADICKNTKIVSHIVGCLDTIAYAMRSSVKRQSASAIISTESFLNKLYRITPVNCEVSLNSPFLRKMPYIKRMMINQKMRPYFPDDSQECNFQAFAVSLVPKLGMTIEFANKSSNPLVMDMARTIGDFIREMKILYSNTESVSVMINRFNEAFEKYNIGTILEDLFMREEVMIAEKLFSKSNLSRASIAHQTVELYFRNKQRNCLISCFSLVQNQANEIIEPQALEADSVNLEKFFNAYNSLFNSEKQVVLKELTLNLILQAGRHYLKHPNTEQCQDIIPVKISTDRVPRSVTSTFRTAPGEESEHTLVLNAR